MRKKCDGVGSAYPVAVNALDQLLTLPNVHPLDLVNGGNDDRHQAFAFISATRSPINAANVGPPSDHDDSSESLSFSASQISLSAG